ncbi:hypothetical protein ACFQZZ_33205 [Nocardia sp. GCM10030253]|uniref:hypothetical protein n=1 Tax=Nocardia sp. GCM10030253 TaxID=3273404 RepID=UPI00363FFE27
MPTLAQLLATVPTSHATGRVRPSALPRMRDQTRLYGADHNDIDVAATARLLDISGLYWASADMTALAVSAGAALDELDFALEARPELAGLMVFDGGVGSTSYDGTVVPVDAVSWGPGPGSAGVVWIPWIARWRIVEAAAAQGVELGTLPPPLVMLAVLPRGLGPIGRDEVGELLPMIAPTVAAWHLMAQPTLTDRWREPADKKTRRAYARDGRGEPDVTIIDLRQLYRPNDPAHAPDEQPGRYSHRWVVTGHWRNQRHGAGLVQRKRIWIPDHVKGPNGAPLLTRERVNVWRR